MDATDRQAMSESPPDTLTGSHAPVPMWMLLNDGADTLLPRQPLCAATHEYSGVSMSQGDPQVGAGPWKAKLQMSVVPDGS